MKCPKCRTVNSDDYLFCSECGTRFSSGAAVSVGLQENIDTAEYCAGENGNPGSVQTQFSPPRNPPGFQVAIKPGPTHTGQSDIQYQLNSAKPRKKLWPFVVVGLLVIFFVLGVGAAIIFKPSLEAWLKTNTQPTEILPDHLGMFYQDKDKAVLNELKKFDSTNIGDAVNKVMNDDSLLVVNEKPEMILYADAVEIPVADLKVVEIESIQKDGTMKQIEFQAAPVDGKPAMKRLRFSQSLAVGPYAFVKVDGYFDEGKHKFWAFVVRGGEKKDNGDLAKELVIATKPKPAPSNTPQKSIASNLPVNKPETIVPPGAKTGYCNDSNVVVRAAASLTARKINSLRRGEKIYVLQYSSSTDSWHGMQANWVYVQTESGKSGWVFSPFISY